MRKTIRVHYEPPVRTLNGCDMRIAGTETKIEQEDCDMVNNNLMSRENQIEEMAKATMKHCKIDNQCGSCHWSTCNECMSEFLYNAGYRKQSEIVRCKDCEYAYVDGDRAYCRNIQTPWYNDYFEVFTEANDFCSYAKMKGGE